MPNDCNQGKQRVREEMKRQKLEIMQNMKVGFLANMSSPSFIYKATNVEGMKVRRTIMVRVKFDWLGAKYCVTDDDPLIFICNIIKGSGRSLSLESESDESSMNNDTEEEQEAWSSVNGLAGVRLDSTLDKGGEVRTKYRYVATGLEAQNEFAQNIISQGVQVDVMQDIQVNVSKNTENILEVFSAQESISCLGREGHMLKVEMNPMKKGRRLLSSLLILTQHVQIWWIQVICKDLPNVIHNHSQRMGREVSSLSEANGLKEVNFNQDIKGIDIQSDCQAMPDSSKLSMHIHGDTQYAIKDDNSVARIISNQASYTCSTWIATSAPIHVDF